MELELNVLRYAQWDKEKEVWSAQKSECMVLGLITSVQEGRELWAVLTVRDKDANLLQKVDLVPREIVCENAVLGKLSLANFFSE